MAVSGTAEHNTCAAVVGSWVEVCWAPPGGIAVGVRGWQFGSITAGMRGQSFRKLTPGGICGVDRVDVDGAAAGVSDGAGPGVGGVPVAWPPQAVRTTATLTLKAGADLPIDRPFLPIGATPDRQLASLT
jgi:hypothetical protein